MVVSNFARARRGREERKVEQLRGLAIAFCATLLVTGCQTAQKQAATTEKETASTQPDRLANLAKEIEGRGEQGTALSLYARAAAMPDASASVSVQAGDAYLRSGHVDEAVTAYKAALAKSPNNGSALLGLGSALVDSGDLDAGIRTLTTAAPVVGTSRAYNRLGVAQTMAGQTQGAISAFQQALKIAPGDVDVLSNMALAAALQNDSATADQAIQQVNASGKAQLFHKRNLVLVSGLLGRDDQMRASAPPGLSSSEVTQILAKARKIRSKSTLTAKGAALAAAA